MNVAVIGGGYAGMAAAVKLAAQHIPVTVFESARQLGGRARGVWHRDTQFDNGQHVLLGCYRHTLDLIRQVGGDIEQDFLRLPLQLTLHHRFQFKVPRLPAPLHLLTGLLTAHGLTIAQRWQAVRFIGALRRSRFRLAQDMTVLELLRAHAQGELIRLLWEPICVSALNTPIHKASAQVLLNVLRESLHGSRADSDMLLPRLDFSRLFPDRAAAFVQQHGGKVLTSCAVEEIIPRDDNMELRTAQGTYRYSHVICAASPVAAARLFKPVPQLASIAAQIKRMTYQPIYTVYMQYPKDVRLALPMLGFDRCYTQWLFDRGQISAQHGLLAAVISAEGIHQALDHPQLATQVAGELNEQLGITGLPLWHQVIAEKHATFSCETDLHRPVSATPLPRLLLAGDYTQGEFPATLEGAVLSGVQCADKILGTMRAMQADA